MGFAIPGWDQIVDWIDTIGGGQGIGQPGDVGGAGSFNDALQSGDYDALIADTWSRHFAPSVQRPLSPYEGGGYFPQRIGWPISIGIESLGSIGSLPSGTFFIGHPPPGLIMESLKMTQTNMDPSLDYSVRGGFSARLVQRDPSGLTRFVSGFELGVDSDGVIVREDLKLRGRDPRTAEVVYGGPIEAYWPLFITLQTYGDFAGVTGLDDVQVQVNATFLCPEVSKAQLEDPPERPGRDYETAEQRRLRHLSGPGASAGKSTPGMIIRSKFNDPS